MKLKDIIQNKKRRGEILRVDSSDSVAKAVEVMVKNDTGSVAVFRKEQFVAMLTFREVLALTHSKGFAAAEKTPCGEITADDGLCATPEDTVDQARNMMTSNHIRYLPIVQQGALTDVISFYDVARAVAKAADFENRMLKQYIGDWPADKEGGEDDEK